MATAATRKARSKSDPELIRECLQRAAAASSEASASVQPVSPDPGSDDRSLQRAVAETKERIANIAGTMPEKVTVIVEF